MEQRQTKKDVPLWDNDHNRTGHLVFCVVADWHGPDAQFEQLERRLIAERPDFVLNPGDLVNADGDDPAPWDRFFAGIRPLLDAGVAFWPVPGNHDFDGDTVAARRQWIERLDLPGSKLFYSFDAGLAHFIGLCITRGILHETFDLPEGRMTQLEWFVRDLERSRDAPWRFIFHHEPGTAFCRLNTPIDGLGSSEVSELVEPRAWRAGVDIIFRGHHHLYERTYPVNPVSRTRDDQRGIGLITVGGGNAGYRPLKPEDAVPRWFDAVISIHQMHYLTIRLNGNELTAEAKNLDGEVFDRFSIDKLPDGSREWKGLPPAPVFLVENKIHSY